MQSELYFDISSEESGGSLYRIKEGEEVSFLYQHSTYNDDTGDVTVYKTTYVSFLLFWEEITKNKQWFYLHPLYVHPEVRFFVQEQLEIVDWTVQGDFKWQESHKRQWKKVLADPGSYYRPSL